MPATRRVVALDGRGTAAASASPDDVSIAAHAADAAFAIEELDLAPAIVVGQSLGGLTAISLAAEHPELVKAMAIVDADPQAGAENVVSDVDEWLRRWPVPFESVLAAARYFGGSPGSAATWANGLERREDGWWPRFDFEVMGRTLTRGARALLLGPVGADRMPGADRPRRPRRRHRGDRRAR